MGKIMKQGKVVVILRGRYAGRKGVILRTMDEGTSDKPYGHAIVGGIDRYPRKLTKKMGIEKLAKRSKVKAFYKALNYNHVMPTRYSVDLPFGKEESNPKSLKDPMKRKKARVVINKLLQQRFSTGKNKWFYQKLRF